MTFPRDYTLAEIDAMRMLVVERVAKDMGLIAGNISTTVVEERLRTYMMAGVTLADLRGGVVKEADPFEDELMRPAGGVINAAGKCKCGENGIAPLHACPYRSEINDDKATLCNCCKKCEIECLDDI